MLVLKVIVVFVRICQINFEFDFFSSGCPCNVSSMPQLGHKGANFGAMQFHGTSLGTGSPVAVSGQILLSAVLEFVVVQIWSC